MTTATTPSTRGRRGRVDAPDPRVRHRRAQDRHVQHPGQGVVVEVVALPGDEAVVLADAGPSGRCRRSRAASWASGPGHGRSSTSRSFGVTRGSTPAVTPKRLWVMSSGSADRCRDGGRRGLDRLHDVHVAGAAADVPGDRPAHVVVASGRGSRSSSATPTSIIPGVQNPHCRPCSSLNAALHQPGTPSAPSSPSTVVTRPAVGLHREHRARLHRRAVDQHACTRRSWSCRSRCACR